MDTTTVARIEKIHPKLKAELSQIYSDINAALNGRAVCRFTQVLRTFAEQDALFAQGRTAKGARVTNARGGQSYHNYGLAVDFCLLVDGKTISWSQTDDYDGDKKADWMEVVVIFKKYGWQWGGDFRSIKDSPHFQKTFGYSEAQLLQLYNAGKRDPSGYVLI